MGQRHLAIPKAPIHKKFANENDKSFGGYMDFFAIQLDQPECAFLGLHFPWIAVIVLAGFLTAWLVVAIMEVTGLARWVWHLPLFFVALLVLFSCGIGTLLLP